MKRFYTYLFAAFALALSCGYASASVEPQHYTLSAASASSHFYVHPGESATAKIVHELALIEWQHAVAKESRFSRSDMYASSAGFVFTSVEPKLDVEGLQNT
ncbi:hypothetical protein ACTACK_10520 [Pseudomonas syringae]|uniref:hypothetical protein n=1 Tax=Pseudomonas syringae TaxID=317 RepID=UPI003F752B06